jgi:hypothetical protein
MIVHIGAPCALAAHRILPMSVSLTCVSLFAEGRLLEVTDSSGMTTSLMKMLNVWPVEGHRNIDAGARGWHISVRYRR